jgi:isopenicillin N synthase-like dioxygenase
VANHGLTSEDIDRQYSLAQSVTSLSDTEKQPYRAALEAGDYNGWKPAGIRELLPGIRDNFEIYNIPKFIPEHRNRAQPAVVTNNIKEIERFSKHIHNEIVRKLLVLFAIVLGLEDEQYFVNLHRYEASSGDHLRYMKYYHRTDEENEKLGGLWLKGYVRFFRQKVLKSDCFSHSDMGSLTLLFRQPVAALQVLTPAGSWKWVKPQENALTVNIADGLHFLTSKKHYLDRILMIANRRKTDSSNQAYTALWRRLRIKLISIGWESSTWSDSKTKRNCSPLRILQFSRNVVSSVRRCLEMMENP